MATKKWIKRYFCNMWRWVNERVSSKIEDINCKIDLLRLDASRTSDIGNMLKILANSKLKDLNKAIGDGRYYVSIEKVETPDKIYPYYYSAYIKDEEIYDGESDMADLITSIKSEIERDCFAYYLIVDKISKRGYEIRSYISKISSSDYLNYMSELDRMKGEIING